jgi:histidine triad (HIT) family protein
VAFLDLGPVRPGHTLVVPKAHYANLLETPSSLAPSLLKVCKAVGAALMRATGATGFNVLQNNFPSAGQTVFHTHWHIIPRVEGDGLIHWAQGAYASPEAMRELAGKIAANMEY